MDGLAIAELLEEPPITEMAVELTTAPSPKDVSLFCDKHPELQKVVGAYRIHEAAEVIPTLAGEAFEAFVQEIAEQGQRDAVIVDGDVLIEGVDTVKAIGVLRERGVDIELQTVSWQPRPGQTVPEYLAYKLLQGPRFTDAQRAQMAADFLPLIEKERAAAQESARIQPGEKRNPRGINKRQENTDDGRETHPLAGAKARNKAKRERSTIGQIAKLANVTEYAAKKAVDIKRLASPEGVSAVKAGIKKPKVVLAGIVPPEGPSKPAAKPPKPIVHPYVPLDEYEQAALQVYVGIFNGPFGVVDKDRVLSLFGKFRKHETKTHKDGATAIAESNCG